MTTDLVEVTSEGPVMTVTLADEERRNVLSPDLVGAVREALAEANAGDDTRVVVLTNRGHVFCAGADLRHQSSEEGRASGRVGGGLEELLVDILDSPTPVVGRIAGHALGGGVGLAAACDISVATAEAKLGFTEVRLGLAPAIISVVCLPKMRRGEAMEAFLRGDRFGAVRAVELGLLNHAVPAAELDAAVAAVIDDLLLAGPGALAAAKGLVRDVPAMARADAFASTARLSADLFASDEGREGMAAFTEKRDPPWRSAGGRAEGDGAP